MSEIRVDEKEGAIPSSDLARRIYDNATEFDYVAEMLKTHCQLRIMTPGDHTVVCGKPMAVICAFTIELYLKCLNAIVNNVAPRGHSLILLFQKLTEPTRKYMQDSYDKLLASDPDQYAPKKMPDGNPYPVGHWGLETVLARLSKSFEEWRYLHEATAELEFSGELMVRIAVVNTIFKYRPDWPNIQDRHGRLPTFLAH